MRDVVCCLVAFSGLLNASSLLDFSYGVLESQRGDPERAAELYESAYKADPLAMPLVRIIVESRINNGDRSGALVAYEQVIAAHPEDAMIHLEYGDFLERIGRGDGLADRKREEAYQQAMEILPGSLAPIERMIRFAREKSDDDRARELLESLDFDSQEAVRYYASITKSLYDGKDEAAQKRIAESYEKALAEHPQWAGIARAASEYFRAAGDLKKAIQMLELHTTAVPSSLDLRIRMGILHFASGQNEEGERALKEVIAIHPRKALAHESLAKFYRKQDQPEQALHHSAEVLKIRGGTAEEFEKTASDFFAAEQFREARLLLEKAVFKHPDNARLLMQLALAAVRDPESQHSALRLFREAENMITDPSDMHPDFLLAFSQELITQGHNQAAEERLRKAIRTFPKTATKETAAALRALAGIWNAEGRNTDAARSLISRAEALEK